MIAHVVRPFLYGKSNAVVFIFGLLPNLAAAFSIPFPIMFFCIQSLRFKIRTKMFSWLFILIVIISMGGLFIWEVVQKLIWDMPFDNNDIWATGIGGVLSILVYILLLSPKKNTA